VTNADVQTPEEFFRAFIATLCERLERCGQDDQLDTLAGPGTDCLEVYTSLFGGSIVTAPFRGTYHAEQGVACIEVVAELPCEGVTTATLQEYVGSCDLVFVGDAALGEACTISDECEGAAYCDLSASCPGVCAAQSAVGAACAASERCAESVCHDGRCVESTPLGQPCGVNLPDCGDEAYCDVKSGTCVEVALSERVLTEGDDCSEPGKDCVEGLYCNLQRDPYICTAFAPPGAECSQDARCRPEQYCQGPNGSAAFEGICVDRLALGAQCNGGSPGCAEGFCRAGRCSYLRVNGTTCAEDAQCVSGFCDPTSDTCGVEPLCHGWVNGD